MKRTTDVPAHAAEGIILVHDLEQHGDAIALEVTDQQFAADPTLQRRFGELGRQKCSADAKRHLSYLGSAITHGSDALFEDYVGWAKILLARLGVPDTDLALNLSFLRAAIVKHVDGKLAAEAGRLIDHALEMLPALPATAASFLAPSETPLDEMAAKYLNLLLAGNRRDASALILGAIEQGTSVRDVYLYVFQRSQREIGRLWQINEISVAQEHFCTAATQMIMSQLYPHIFSTSRTGRRLVATCVGGDLHEIGVRMVADFFEMAGWDTYYLGANTPLPGILQAVEEHRPDTLAISATMSFHVPQVGAVIEAARSRFGESPSILVGGYPFGVDADLWRQVGADGCASDASGAVSLATALVEKGAHD